MYPRRLILNNNSYSHVFFRCHNRHHFLKPPVIKKYFLWLLAKYKVKYGVKVYEFIIMDNHVHLLIKSECTSKLGDFMRVVNSQLARKINQHFKRDSQAIRERYKSPCVSHHGYMLSLMKYIWFNRLRVDKTSDPKQDPYCSLSWRLGNTNPQSLYELEEDKENISTLLDPISELPLELTDTSPTFISKMISKAMKALSSLTQKVFENSHTIGDTEAVRFRGEALSAFSRQKTYVFEK